MAETTPDVIIGIDTHKATNVVALVSTTGQRIAHRRFDVSARGYGECLEWIAGHGRALRAGIEGTGSYGAGIAGYLSGRGIECLEVHKCDKQERCRRGKDDVVDAYQAAQAALAYERCAPAKEKGGLLQAAEALEAAYALAVKNRTSLINALKGSVVKLPPSARERLEPLATDRLVDACSAFRIREGAASLDAGTRKAMRSLARQIRFLDQEIKALDDEVARYAEALLPQTLALYGIGPHTGIRLLSAAGQNIGRMRNEASFSMLCGTSPVPASTGDRHHFRLNRGGNRQANAAIHTMARVRMRNCEKTKAYIEKKMSEGKTKKDAIRALKRYLSREVFNSLKADLGNMGNA